LFFFNRVQDMNHLNPRRAQGEILKRMDPISRTKVTMLSILANPLILLLPVEDRALLKNDDSDQDLETNFKRRGCKKKTQDCCCKYLQSGS